MSVAPMTPGGLVGPQIRGGWRLSGEAGGANYIDACITVYR